MCKPHMYIYCVVLHNILSVLMYPVYVHCYGPAGAPVSNDVTHNVTCSKVLRCWLVGKKVGGLVLHFSSEFFLARFC